MTDSTDAMDVLDYEPKINPETGRELMPNPERGCGYLDHGKAYIRTDPVRSSDGEIPTFVVFDPPIPYKEGTLRSYQQFDGLAFQRSTADKFDTIPEDDLSDLWDRLEASEDGDHWGAITTAYAQDLLMWVGETYYEDPTEFIRESRRFGLNKAIPVSKRQEPPAINPMNTRVFLVHPTAYRVYEQTTVDDDGEETTEQVRVSYREDDNDLADDDAEDPVETISGVIGYSYLTRVVWTAPTDDDIPKWAEQYQDTGQLDIVDVGEPVESDEVDRRLEQFDGSITDPEIRRKADAALAGAAEVLSPGHGGDVDAGDDEADGSDPADTGDDKSTDTDSDAAERTTVDDLPDDYNERKRMAADVDADVSAQPSNDELNQAILNAVNEQ